MSKKLNRKFFEGRTPPDADYDSIVFQDWYTEQQEYVLKGRTIDGTYLTGDHYHLLNFCNIFRVVDHLGNVDWDFPDFSLEDDYIFKQDEEAFKSQMYTGLLTWRGFGKTYLALSKSQKNFNWIPFSQSIISASIDETAARTFSMADLMLLKSPDFLKHNRLKNEVAGGNLSSGTWVDIEGVQEVIGNQSSLVKVIYDNNAGKTRGARPHFQLFEEIGAWTGAAKLEDCLLQSKGSFFRGSYFTCNVWLIGTGGQMKSGGSLSAQKLFYNAEAFRIYPVQEWYGKRTFIFIPAYRKFHGYYDPETGENDEIGAKEVLTQRRKEAEALAEVYWQEVQEFPFEPKEAFMTSGNKLWDVTKLQKQRMDITVDSRFHGIIQHGKFFWKKDLQGKITGVEFCLQDDGPVELLEHPERNEQGEVPPNLYIAGIDSVDNDVNITGKTGKKVEQQKRELSKFAMLVKKRLYSVKRTHNIYVGKIFYRPNSINDAYEQSLMMCIYFRCQANVEHTKVGVIKYFEQKKAIKFLFPRPSVCYADVVRQAKNNRYGTSIDGAGKVLIYGYDAIAKYVESFYDQIFFEDLLAQLVDFDPQFRTMYDLIMAMMMTELADDELLDIVVKEATKEKPFKGDLGYYNDHDGVRRFGSVPTKKTTDELFPKNRIDYLPDFNNLEEKN